ncbi:MAG: ABC transporter permease [Clostridiaceae bacterium]|nr:ABC transporter permease [Eubacteriales bacterium]NLV48075.1 ABC transporter permease [Clostridiaceae bacterium]
MKVLLFAKRNIKEILRDPINLFFGIGFPLVLLILFSIINKAIPDEAGNTMFSIEKTTPGIASFGTAFFALFSGMLLAKDKTTSFLMRLFSSPMTVLDFLIGYTLPLLLMALIQGITTFLAGSLLGLPLSVNSLLSVLFMLPITIFFVGLGLLCGSLLNEKAVSGICGALLTNIAGWFSGVWIPLDLIGGIFKKAAEALPFFHSVETLKEVISGEMTGILPHIAIVLGYAVIFYGLAALAFRRKMHSDKV